MKKVILFIAVCILGLITSFEAKAQNAIPVINLNNFKWGLKDSATFEVIMRPKCTYISPFKSGLAIMKTDSLYGIINQRGEVVSPPEYSQFHWVNDTLIKLKKGGKYGLLNAALEEVMPFNFNSLFVFDELMVVNNGAKSGIIDLNGNIIIPFDYDEILIEYNQVDKNYLNKHYIRVVDAGKSGVIDYQNNIVVPIENDWVSFWPNDQFFLMRDKAYGLVGQGGEVYLPLNKYDHFDVLCQGLRVAAKKDQFGYIDAEENRVVPFIYENSKTFQYGIGALQKNGLWGGIGLNNEIKLPFEYAEPLDFKCGLAKLQRVEGDDTSKYAFFSPFRGFVTDFVYDMASDFDANLAKVKCGNKWGVLDTNGKEIIPAIYDEVFIDRGFIKVILDKKHGLYSLSGREILPPNYSFIYPKEGETLIMIRQGRKYGYSNLSGQIVIPLIYDNARSFSGHFAAVLLNGESFEIDRKGNRIREEKL